MKVRFWGVRGSIPVPGATTNRYGGNTSCVEVRPGGGPLIVIDAGTGIRRLGKALLHSEFGEGKGAAHLLISHTHWDHIQGLPFFAPLYVPGNDVRIYALQRDDTHLRAVFRCVTDEPYFSVPFDSVQAAVSFCELTDTTRFQIDGVHVQCTRLNHPWIAIAYRLESDGASVCYVSDTAPFRNILLEHEFVRQPPPLGEPLPPAHVAKLVAMREGVVSLCRNADVVIYDTMFTQEEYALRPHWGHSSPEDAIEIIREAGARKLVLFHHDPTRTDDQVDEQLARYRAANPDLAIDAAFEGLELTVRGGG
jgi:phosphoribosyl 1,2-cyclic phosphodiesterase